MVSRSPDEDRSRTADLVNDLTARRRAATPPEVAALRQYFALRVLPERPTARVLEKHAQHAEDDPQWPEDTSVEEYLESLRATILDHRSGVYLVEADVERTWTIYFVGAVRRRWRGPSAGQRIVVLFNAERHFWITGFQAEDGDLYVDRRGGFWTHRPG